MVECTVTSIKELLDGEKIASRIEPAADNFPFERLILEMGVDAEKQPQEIILYIVEKALSLSAEEGSKKNPRFITMQYFFPFSIQEQAFKDIARYLLLINKTLEFGSFEMSESDRLVYFRYDLYGAHNKISSDVLKGLLGYLLWVVDAFQGNISLLSSGKKTFAQIVAEI